MCNKSKRLLSTCIATLLFAPLWSGPPAAAELPVGTTFTYSGDLQQGGSPVDDTCAFEFSLWNDPDSVDQADQVGSTLMQTVDVAAGRFTSALDFGPGIFTGAARWLEIAVCCPPDDCTMPPTSFTTLLPRQELTPAPYALALPALRTVFDPTSPNVIGGARLNSVSPGVFGGVVAGGGNQGNGNKVSDRYGVVSGGLNNRAGDNAGDAIGSGFATVSGGANNLATEEGATVGGGQRNTATGQSATIAGGFGNDAAADYATIAGGGRSDPGDPATGNRVTDDYGTIGGGGNNQAGDNDGTTGDTSYATVGGGFINTASGSYATVPGGAGNVATGDYATGGGGNANTASGDWATVGGGSANTASGPRSTVPGGSRNSAGGEYSFAAGRQAKVRDAAASGDADGDEGTFVWADSTLADFVSTGPDQFLIRASGGVGIGTTTPSEKLDVDGTINTSTQYNIGGDPVVVSVAADGNLFVGVGAGQANTASFNNSFFGKNAGFSNTTGIGNSFFGVNAGLGSTRGGGNAYFGASAGGGSAEGVSNAFFGTSAGIWNTTGALNTAIGTNAGPAVGQGGLEYATAVGADAEVSQSNSVVLGRSDGSDTVRIPGDLVVSGTIDTGSGNTLDGAYDQGGAGAGRTITADAGAVEILGPDGLTVAGSIQSGSSIIIDGTTDTITSNGDLELHVNAGRALRLETNATSPNIVGGHPDNSVTAGAFGATIGGGGQAGAPNNRVTDNYGTIGGGSDNQAGDNDGTTVDRIHSTVGGGSQNTASGLTSTVGGGFFNTASGNRSTVGGGGSNTASGANSAVGGGDCNTASGPNSTIGGGGWILGPNVASDFGSTVGGGLGNSASAIASTVGGGNSNTASGIYSTVPGGFSSAASGAYGFAAGRRAQADHEGAFVWADSTDADFASSAANQFLIRASGGVGIGTSSPGRDLEIKKSVDGVVHGGVRNQNTGASALALLAVNADDAQGSFAAYSSNYVSATFRDRVALSSATNSAGLLLAATAMTGDIRLFTGGFASSNQRMTIDSDGNVGIGTTSPVSSLQIRGGDLTFEDSISAVRSIRNSGTIVFAKDTDNNSIAWFRWLTDGNNIEQMRIMDGDEASILGDGTFVNNGIDYAEGFKVLSDESDLEAGEVVSLAIGQWEYARRTTEGDDPHIIGVVSTNPGFLTGMSFDAEDAADPAIAQQRDEAQARGDHDQARALTEQLMARVEEIYRPIALAGRVPCKVDGQYGDIRAGDRITSSPTPGHAMKQTKSGPSIGVALEDWTGPGTGKVMVLVQPGWFGVSEPGTGEPARSDSGVVADELATLRVQMAAMQQQLAELTAKKVR